MPPTIDERLRELAEATHEQVNPSPDLLRRIRASTSRHGQLRTRSLPLLGLVAAAAVIAITVAAVTVTRASAHRRANVLATSPPVRGERELYWSNPMGIGRANLDGTGMIQKLIPFSGVDSVESAAACGIAVDRNYAYWPTGGTLARAKLDGTGIDARFIVIPAGAQSCVAVDATHIYWATASGWIGRANLDGTGVNKDFIAGLGADPGVPTAPCGLAVDAAHIYWTNPSIGTIGRANLDGTGVNQDFMTGLGTSTSAIPEGPNGPQDGPCGIAVDGAHIYWGTPAGTIGRANLDGTGVNTRFISALGLVCGHDSTYLYWASPGSPGPSTAASIGRARLDGTDVRADFIPRVDPLAGCAVSP
jgi:hypothetical protein